MKIGGIHTRGSDGLPTVAFGGYQDTFDEEILLGRYLVEGEAGSGAFGSVVNAWDTRIERRVAIKCMPLEEAAGLLPSGSVLVGERCLDTSSIAGLEEARTAAKLSDPSIVSVYDFEVNGAMAYLILEYVDGMTLAELLSSYHDKMNIDIVAAIFKAVSHALKVAHEHHVLHLDIKPENVLIDCQGRVKVTDFGLARLLTETGYGAATGGTIGYMPPEQMTCQELDERCDQWALASLTYEMIAGSNPFVVDSLEDAQDAIYDAELVVPSLCMEGCDEDIDDIMFCALDPDPEERYDSVKDFAEQLQPCLGSVRKGRNALKRLVGDAYADDIDEGGAYEEGDEVGDDDGYDEDNASWRRTVDIRAVVLRLWAAANAGIVAFLSINSLLGIGAWGSQPASWGALVACITLTAIFPRIGVLVVGEAFGVALCASNAPVPGVVFMVATGSWWFFSARHCLESAVVGSSSVLFGAVGLAPLTVFAAGFLLSARDAIISVLYAACLAIMLAGLGSGSMVGWNLFAYAFTPIGDTFNTVVLNLISTPELWMMVLAWVLASVSSSLLCGTGKRFLCVLGMIVAGAFLIGGLIAASLLVTAGKHVLDDPTDLIAPIGVTVLGSIVAGFAQPRRQVYRKSSDRA